MKGSDDLSAFIISFLFAAAQLFLLRKLLIYVTDGNRRKIVLYMLIKFFAYGIAIALLMFKFLGNLMYCLCGFAAGMPLCAFGYFIYLAFIKKR